jgi:hypothetical protein
LTKHFLKLRQQGYPCPVLRGITEEHWLIFSTLLVIRGVIFKVVRASSARAALLATAFRIKALPTHPTSVK